MNDRIQRYIVLLVFSFVQLILIDGYSQTAKLTIQLKDTKVQEILSVIEKKSQMVFYYLDKDVDLNRRLTIDIEEQSIVQVLDELFKNSPNIYKIDGTRIYIYKKTKDVDNLSIPQTKKAKITGLVLDENNESIIGANVMLNGNNTGTITDINGRFSIEAFEDSQLRVSYIGYETKVVNIEKKTSLKILLDESLKTLDELVVVGYGIQKKETVVGSVTQVNSDKIKERGVVTNITDALSGSMPGVTVMTSTGAPGGSASSWTKSSSILIRGANTWNNTSPLILVDGIERNMNDIDINEIASFSVLKDASATAVFGVKGANGVILITTKRGQIGKPKVTFESNYSIKTVSSVKGPVDSYQALLARNYAIVNELAIGGNLKWNAYYIPERELNYYRDKVDPEKYPDVDWFDFMTRDYAISSKYNFTVSGGTDFVKYFTSVGYISDGDVLNTETPNSKGVTPEFKYERFNFRSNFDFTITNTTQLRVNLSGYIGKQQSPTGNFPNIMAGLMTANPNQPLPIYSDGMYGGGDPSLNTENAYKNLMSRGANVSNRNSFNSDFELKQQLGFITKGLSFKGRFSFDNYYNTIGRDINDDGLYIDKYWDRVLDKWVVTTPVSSTGFEFVPTPLSYTNETAVSNVLRNIYYEFGLTYSRTFNMHRIGALALMSRENFVTGSNWPSKREDWVGRLTYDYKGIYLFEMNGAYNGSAKFGPNYRFDFFPSLAVGWRVSEEKFIKNHLPQLSNLKIKYSIGKIGSDNFNGLGMWPYITSYVNNPDRLARFGNGALTNTPYDVAFREGTPGNPNLMWETALKQDLGLEFELFDGTISGGADYFDEYRYDMLIAADQRSIPDYYGATPSAANIGKVHSNGFEFEIKLQKKFGKVGLWAAGNWTKAVNEVIYKEDPVLRPAYQKKEGYSIGQNTSYVVGGVIQSWDQMYTGVLYESAYINNTMLIPGDFRMVDYNTDGKINSQDIVPYQYATYPQNTYGISFGGDYASFALNLQFYGTYNTSLLIDRLSRNEFLNSSPVVYPEQLNNTFTPEYGNSNPTYRTLNFSRSDGSFNGSSFLYDASFLRLKSAEISYSFPKKMISKLNIDKCRLYLNGNNLFLWSDLPYDVEGVALDYRNYPTTKLYNLGLQVTF